MACSELLGKIGGLYIKKLIMGYLIFRCMSTDIYSNGLYYKHQYIIQLSRGYHHRYFNIAHDKPIRWHIWWAEEEFIFVLLLSKQTSVLVFHMTQITVGSIWLVYSRINFLMAHVYVSQGLRLEQFVSTVLLRNISELWLYLIFNHCLSNPNDSAW